WHERALMATTSVILLAVELTLAKTKPNALFFIICILLAGFGLRALAQRRTPLEAREDLHPNGELQRSGLNSAKALPDGPVGAILVAARGWTQVLRFAVDEACLRGAVLYVLYVRIVAVSMPGPASTPEPQRWQEDRPAAEIMYGMFELAAAAGVRMLPVYVR